MTTCPTGRCAKGARCGECMESDGLTRPASGCSCDPAFAEFGVHDVACPEHGVDEIRRALDLAEGS